MAVGRTFPSAGLAPIDSYLVNPGARRAGAFEIRVDAATATDTNPLKVRMKIGANVGAPTAFSIYVEPNLDGGNPTMGTLTALNIYMEDIDSATVNHLIGIDIGLNSNNTAVDWHTFIRIKNHSGTAKSIFKINAAADYLIDFSDAESQVPVSASTHSTNVSHKIAVRMADNSTRYLQLTTD